MEILEAAIKAKHGAYESVEAKYDAYKSVKSYSDACKVLGIKPYPFKKGAKIGDMDLSLDVVDMAKIKLITITKALNKLDACSDDDNFYIELDGASSKALEDSPEVNDTFNLFVIKEDGKDDEYCGLGVVSELYDKPMLSSLTYHSYIVASYSAKQFSSLWGEYLTGREPIPWREFAGNK